MKVLDTIRQGARAEHRKTDVRLIRTDGTEVRRAVGGPFRPQSLGVSSAMAVLDELVDEPLPADTQAETPTEAQAGAQAPAGATPRVRGIAAFLAGADLPEEIATLHREIETRPWAHEVYVANDTFAVLHAGSPQPQAVTVPQDSAALCLSVSATAQKALVIRAVDSSANHQSSTVSHPDLKNS